MVNKILVVVGSGPGIGIATGAHFASKGFDVALLARNPERLAEGAATVQGANSKSKVVTYPVDISDHKALQKTLKMVEVELGAPEVVLFNAATMLWNKIGETDPETLIQAYKTMTVGLYVAAAWAAPHLVAAAQRPDAHPSIFLSGGPIQDQPFADIFVLSIQKAAQFNFMGSLKQVVGSKGVHVASVNIGGAVRDDEPILNAKNIASQYWRLHEQDEVDWEWQVKLGGMDYWEDQKSRGVKS